MHIQVRDENTRKIIRVASYFTSLIWTERFNSPGDFELVLPLTKQNYDDFKVDRYIFLYDRPTLMIIEKVIIDLNEMSIKATGQSFESVLYRRICKEWNPNIGKTIPDHPKNKFGTTLQYVISDGFGVDEDHPDETAEYIKYEGDNIDRPSDDITAQKVDYAQRGDDFGTYFYELAQYFNVGVRAKFDQETENIYFSIYDGTLKKNMNFGSSSYNLEKASFTYSTENLLTSAMIAGEGEGENRKTVSIAKSLTVYNEDGSIKETNLRYTGVQQRQTYVDARDIQKESGETNDAYIQRLKDKGQERLFSSNFEQSIDGKITDNGPYRLYRDYGLGDVVTIKNEYFTAEVKIKEIIRSWDNSGYSAYPTFEALSVTNGTTVTTTNIIDE